jgi:hypothetical protein
MPERNSDRCCMELICPLEEIEEPLATGDKVFAIQLKFET